MSSAPEKFTPEYYPTGTLYTTGVATGVARGGRVLPLTVKKLSKIEKKSGKIGEKEEKSGRKTKIGKVLSLCPS